MTSLDPPISHVALLHGNDEVTNPWYLGGRVNLGVQNGKEVALKLGVRYWITTHDEDKKAEGFVRRVLRREKHTFEDVSIDGVECRVLASGESINLE